MIDIYLRGNIFSEKPDLDILCICLFICIYTDFVYTQILQLTLKFPVSSETQQTALSPRANFCQPHVFMWATQKWGERGRSEVKILK